MSEWPRSKFPASAVRQRRNFGHRNRVIRIPRSPRPPLPKGGWHGEAVTGGFFPRTHGRAHGPCPTKILHTHIERTGSSAPTSISVGATLTVARPTAHLVPVRRGRRLPTVVPTDSRPLLWPPIGALPRNQLASSATGGASPISPTPRSTARLVTLRRGRCLHRPARAYTAPLVNGVIAKPVRTLAVAIRSPRPLCKGDYG